MVCAGLGCGGEWKVWLRERYVPSFEVILYTDYGEVQNEEMEALQVFTVPFVLSTECLPGHLSRGARDHLHLTTQFPYEAGPISWARLKQSWLVQLMITACVCSLSPLLQLPLS
jgi:hypothetical protein